jgi:hypothetical protein
MAVLHGIENQEIIDVGKKKTSAIPASTNVR